MKKLGQKLSFLTKIMLVMGLLISNLSSLSVVFAYEAVEDLVISLNEESLEISYTKELAEEVEAVNVKVYESYTYLDGTPETFDGGLDKVIENVYSLTEEELLAAKEGTLKLAYDSIFTNEEINVDTFKLFDGTYNVKVELVDVTDYSEEIIEEENNEDVVVVNEEESTELETDVDEDITLINEDESVVETVVTFGTYEKTITHKSGLDIKIYDADNNNEILLNDGKYPVSIENSKIKVVAKILSGGLNPTDVFLYDGEELNASELIRYGFGSEFDFSGRLYGEYELPVEVKVLKTLPVEIENVSAAELESVDAVNIEEELNDGNYEELIYTDSIEVLYESYSLNSYLLNVIALQEGYGETYLFNSEDKEGTLYVLSEFEEVAETTEETVVTRTMLDLYNLLNEALGSEEETSLITYTLLKGDVNVLDSYVPANEEDTLEKYLSTIKLDDTVKVVLSNDGLSISYNVVFVGDFDSDGLVTKSDVLDLIDQVVGEKEVTNVNKSDLDADGKVNSLDVLYLNQVVKNKAWEADLIETEAELDAKLEVKKNQMLLSEENNLVSGDEFTVDYVLSLSDYEVNGIAGVFDYDKTLFELISIEVANDWTGNSYEGKFLYLGEESLTGPELETEIPENTENVEIVTDVDDSEELDDTVEAVDYVVLTATFKALKSTSEESNNVVTLKEIELFNSTEESITYYELDNNSVSTENIIVNASDDNTLQYLEVAGVKIELEEGIYDYEITVASDVTLVDLKYILNNVAASVTSTIYPEELAEGSNTVVVTVTSESGISQDYTVTVIREEVKKETTTQVSYDNYYNNYQPEENENEVIVTPGEIDKEEDNNKKEDSNLSRIIIIILILIVIAGLVYLIFKDDDDETKKANKAVNKLKKESLEPEVKVVNKPVSKSTNKNVEKTNSGKSNKKPTNNNKKNDSKNRKKER